MHVTCVCLWGAKDMTVRECKENVRKASSYGHMFKRCYDSSSPDQGRNQDEGTEGH